MENIKTRIEIQVDGQDLPIRIETTDDPDVVLVDAVVLDGKVHISDILVGISKLKLNSDEYLGQILEDELWRMNG